jgi:hypothetical protein
MNCEPFDEALQRLDEKLRRFPFRRDEHKLYIAHSSRAEQLLDLDRRELDFLDDVCRKWAENTGESLLDEASSHLLYARFQHAHRFGHWLYGKVAFPQKSTAEILVFFLVDHWRCYGRAVWISQMMEFCRRRS